jgi:hypothetical protein
MEEKSTYLIIQSPDTASTAAMLLIAMSGHMSMRVEPLCCICKSSLESSRRGVDGEGVSCWKGKLTEKSANVSLSLMDGEEKQTMGGSFFKEVVTKAWVRESASVRGSCT